MNHRKVLVIYNPVEINREELTIIGINFNSVNNLDATINVLGTVMYEVFDPNSPKR